MAHLDDSELQEPEKVEELTEDLKNTFWEELNPDSYYQNMKKRRKGLVAEKNKAKKRWAQTNNKEDCRNWKRLELIRAHIFPS